MKSKSLFAALIVLTLSAGRASAWLPEDTDCFTNSCPNKAAMRALGRMADTPVQGNTAELLKSAADVQMAPVTGAPVAQAVPPVTDGVILPPAEGGDSEYHGGPTKRGAQAGFKAGVNTVRWTGSILKLPFAAVGGVIGGIVGATRAMFTKDDDDHTNSVGAGFMLGASAAGHYAGKAITFLLTIPALVVGAVGSILGGIFGFFKGLFTKSENK